MIDFLSYLLFYQFHPGSFNFGPSDLLVVFRTWQALFPIRVFVRTSLLERFFHETFSWFSLSVHISPQRHMSDHFIQKNPTFVSLYSLNMLDFPSKHTSLLEIIFFFVCLFIGIWTLSCGGLAFLFLVEFSVITAVPATLKISVFAE